MVLLYIFFKWTAFQLNGKIAGEWICIVCGPAQPLFISPPKHSAWILIIQNFSPLWIKRSFFYIAQMVLCVCGGKNEHFHSIIKHMRMHASEDNGRECWIIETQAFSWCRAFLGRKILSKTFSPSFLYFSIFSLPHITSACVGLYTTNWNNVWIHWIIDGSCKTHKTYPTKAAEGKKFERKKIHFIEWSLDFTEIWMKAATYAEITSQNIKREQQTII